MPVSSQEWTETLTSKSGVTKPVDQQQFGFEADHLNETGFWDPNEFLVGNFLASTYERKVRNVYLGIAQDVTESD